MNLSSTRFLPISKALGPIDATDQTLTDPNRLREPSPSWKASAAPSFSSGHQEARQKDLPRLFPTDCKSSSSASVTSEFDPKVSARKLSMGLRDSTRKLLRKLSSRDKKQEEVNQLQPVALAGASKRSTHRSELCSTFAATAVSREELEGRRKAMSEGSADWEQCGMCTRSFVAGTSRYAGFCSLDCNSAALYSQSARVYRGRYRNA